VGDCDVEVGVTCETLWSAVWTAYAAAFHFHLLRCKQKRGVDITAPHIAVIVQKHLKSSSGTLVLLMHKPPRKGGTDKQRQFPMDPITFHSDTDVVFGSEPCRPEMSRKHDLSYDVVNQQRSFHLIFIICNAKDVSMHHSCSERAEGAVLVARCREWWAV